MTASTPAVTPGTRTTLRLHVDWTLCEGRGACLELLPEALAEDPWGYPMPAHPDPEGLPAHRGIAVPAHLRAAADLTVRSCPRMALRLE